MPLDDSSREGVMVVLRQFQKSIEEMDADYKFKFEPPAATPKKRGRPSAASDPESEVKSKKPNRSL